MALLWVFVRNHEEVEEEEEESPLFARVRERERYDVEVHDLLGVIRRRPHHHHHPKTAGHQA
jgi:hypothetical protein